MELTVIVQVAVSVGVGLTFLASSLSKLRHPKGFLLTVLQYDVLPAWLARTYARGLPTVELLLASCLILGVAVSAAAVVAAGVLLTFVLGILINIARSRDLECGCFGKRHRKVGWPLVVQDVGLFTACIGMALLGPKLGLNCASWSPLAGIHLLPGELIAAVPAVLSLAGTAFVRRWPRRERRWSYTPAAV